MIAMRALGTERVEDGLGHAFRGVLRLIPLAKWSHLGDRGRGSAAVEFVLVAPLVLLIFLAILQVALAAYVRTTLTSVAAEAARVGALAGSQSQVAKSRALKLANETFASDVVTEVSARQERADGLATIAVRIEARLPLFGLLGPTTQTITAHALVEGP